MIENKYFATEDLRHYIYLVLAVGAISFALFWIFLFGFGPLGGGALLLGLLTFVKTFRNILFPHKYKNLMKQLTTIILLLILFLVVFAIVAVIGILFGLGNSTSI